MIRCRLFGPVELTIDGLPAPKELFWRKNIALLVYLIRSPRRGRSRDHLAALFWPDKEEANAKHSLSEAVSTLKGALGDALLADAVLVRLDPTAVDLDLDRFEALAASENWDEAAQLVEGDFMETFAVKGASDVDTWLTSERTEWRRRGVQALLHAADRAAQSGGSRAASELAQRALVLDPLSQPAVRALMHALALDGERQAALDQLLGATRRLHDAGLEVEPETEALGERIRRGKDWRLAADTRTAAVLYSRRAPLSGRADELGRLLQTWKACREARRAAVLVIHGDVGVGKTRLLEELLDRVRLEQAIGVAACAVEADVREPWSLLFALASGGLLDAPGVSAAQPEAIDTIAARIPTWRERFPRVSGTASLSPAQALTDVLNAVLEEQPLVLAIDDAHWADSSTLLALAALVRDLGNTPLLVCLATSDGAARQEIDALRVRIPRDVPGAVVGLGPLPVQAIRELASWALPRYSETEADRVARRVAMDSAALPLLAIELLHAVALGLDLRDTTGAWPQPFRTLSHTLPGDLPDAVVAAIRIGYRRLTLPAQRALAAAAVLGDREVAVRIGKGSGISGDVLAESLDELEWQRWLTADPRGYRFVARIARDVIARDMVTPGQRERIIAAADGRDG